MATTSKPGPKGPGDDPAPPPGSSSWTDYIQSLYGSGGAPPVTQIPTTQAGSTPGRWSPPTVAPNFQFPQGLLAQIAQSQQEPMYYGGDFGRYQFSQGAPKPPTSPPGWGRAPVTGQPARPPVAWPQAGNFSAANKSTGTAVPPPGGVTSAPPAAYNPTSGGLLGTSATAASGTSRPPGLLSWGTQQPNTKPPITAGPTPAQGTWSPDPSKTPAQNMSSYNAYISQSPAAFLAGFNAQPTQQAKIQYIMGLPPTASSQLMNDPQVQAALGGANWRQNFTEGYYNAPAR